MYLTWINFQKQFMVDHPFYYPIVGLRSYLLDNFMLHNFCIIHRGRVNLSDEVTSQIHLLVISMTLVSSMITLNIFYSLKNTKNYTNEWWVAGEDAPYIGKGGNFSMLGHHPCQYSTKSCTHDTICQNFLCGSIIT